MMKTLLAATALVALASASQAATTLFEDDFESNRSALNGTPNGWTVSNGTVDIVGPDPYIYPEICSADGGYCIDMDGSTGNAGRLTSNQSFSLMTGVEYTLTFDYSWNWFQQGNGNTMTFGVGTFSDTLTTTGSRDVGVPQPYTPLAFSFTGDGSTGAIFFDHAGNDNGGIVIDNVKLTGDFGNGGPGVVPLPAGLPLVLTAFGSLALLRRRKG